MNNPNTPSPAVSVIIPVYNLENYLDACLASVERQTFPSFEALVVDDGSTDRTSEVLKRHADRDPRIVAIRKSNEGVAKARETALEHTRGRYICFLDGDDLWEPDMLERLVAAIEEPGKSYDIVCCNYKRISKSYEAPVREKRTADMEGLEYLEASLRHAISVTLWGRIYRRELFDGAIRHYPLRLGQDSMINIQIGCKRPRVRFIDYVGYGYVQRAGSSNHRNFDFAYCQTFSRTVDEVLTRHEQALEGRKEYLHLLNSLRWYLVYVTKSSSPWVGGSEYARTLREKARRYAKELRPLFSPGRRTILRLDASRALRPIVVILATLLRWQNSLQRRFSR